LHQVGDLFELNVKLRCHKVNDFFTATTTKTTTTEAVTTKKWNKIVTQPAVTSVESLRIIRPEVVNLLTGILFT
jgi:hypothetical protein